MNSSHWYELHGLLVLEYSESSVMIQNPQDATHLIGEALAAKADWVYLPRTCLSDAFFQLRSGLAGEVVQKFVNYQTSLAVVGDVGPKVTVSSALGDFVREANHGRDIWFVADRGEFEEKLKGRRGAVA